MLRLSVFCVLVKSEPPLPPLPDTDEATEVTRVAKPERKVTSDDYTFLKVLGRGAFGKVYMAEDKKTKEVVAIKVRLLLLHTCESFIYDT